MTDEGIRRPRMIKNTCGEISDGASGTAANTHCAINGRSKPPPQIKEISLREGVAFGNPFARKISAVVARST